MMQHSHDAAILPEDRDGFRFRGGATVLDLTATLQARLKPLPRELLATPRDLERWLASAGIAAVPSATEEDLEIARDLREAIYALASGAAGSSLDPNARDRLNRIAGCPPAIPVLTEDGQVKLQGSAKALLASLARGGVHLFARGRSQPIRQCEASECSIFFLDTSRSGHRRWCSMAACGNKAKVTALRERRRSSTTR